MHYPFVSNTSVGALARESGAKSPCKCGSDSDICNNILGDVNHIIKNRLDWFDDDWNWNVRPARGTV